ncbi:hypothetical protein HMPREF9135_1549 [Segatella baroniae F0067]|uniref:Uncharacterized protein n=1 Tax=Segatella baroniae F0067 TaxID=1115809 RepID=U2P3I4_9BACT|nr:hypothetical protein HMPREF9135_1549 [Segatella baroniae F0067]
MERARLSLYRYFLHFRLLAACCNENGPHSRRAGPFRYYSIIPKLNSTRNFPLHNSLQSKNRSKSKMRKDSYLLF